MNDQQCLETSWDKRKDVSYIQHVFRHINTTSLDIQHVVRYGAYDTYVRYIIWEYSWSSQDVLKTFWSVRKINLKKLCICSESYMFIIQNFWTCLEDTIPWIHVLRISRCPNTLVIIHYVFYVFQLCRVYVQFVYLISWQRSAKSASIMAA